MITQDTGVQINPHIQIQNFIAVIVILNHRVETVHHTQDPPIIKINQLITLITHIQLTNNTYSLYYNRDGIRSRRPISRNRLRNVRNYINSLLDQEQTDDTMSNTENCETQKVSEEKLLGQQFNDCLCELNQDTQDEYFNCQEECITLTEEYILSTSCKSNIWVLPLTICTQQTLDYRKTFSPAHIENDFFLVSGATLKVLINDTWNETKENHKLQIKTLTFVLSTANNSKLQSNGTMMLILYPDVTENRTL